MKNLLPHLRRLAPLAASAVLFGLVPAARADQTASTLERVGQASGLTAERATSAGSLRPSAPQISSAITEASVTSGASAAQRTAASPAPSSASAPQLTGPSPTPNGASAERSTAASLTPNGAAAEQSTAASPTPNSAADASAVGSPPAGAGRAEGGASSPEAATLSGPAADAETGTSPPSTESISKAVQQAIEEALSRQAQRSDAPGAETLAADATATSQLIWQLQIAQCTAHCVGTTQGQHAVQQNTTFQVLESAPRAAGSAGGREHPSTQTNVSQIQLGCISHCYGATTRTPASTIASYAWVLEEALRQIAAGLPSLAPILALERSVVAQSSYQSQSGVSPSASSGRVTQSEEAVQVHNARQLNDASGSTTRDGAAKGVHEANTFGAVNQTEQEIWQLQIGCLFDCHETEQYQQATQLNATVEKVIQAPGAATPSASTQESVTQVIFQAQIGCMLWCFDATERQAASSKSTHSGGGPPQAAPPAGEATPNTPGVGSVSAPPAATAGSLPASGEAAAVPGVASVLAGNSTPSSKQTAPRRSVPRRSPPGVVAARAGVPQDLPAVVTDAGTVSSSRRLPAARDTGFSALASGNAPATVAPSSVPVALAALALCALFLLCVALLRLRALTPSSGGS